MGLNFCSKSQSFDAQWSFGGFKIFRVRLAQEIGIDDINSMKGFCDEGNLESVGGRSWSEIDDVITPLLCHCDIEGDLNPEQCAQIAPRLRELVTDWPDAIEIETQPEHQAIGYPAWLHLPEHDKRNAILLAEAMEWCAEHEESLIFSG